MTDEKKGQRGKREKRGKEKRDQGKDIDGPPSWIINGW